MGFSTGFPRADAQDDFLAVRRRQVLCNLGRLLLGRDRSARQVRPLDVLTYPVGITSKPLPGTHMIPVAHIVGSVDRAPDFDPEFRPRSDRCRWRWERIAEVSFPR